MEAKNYNIYKQGEHGNWILMYAYKRKNPFYNRLREMGQNIVDGGYIFRTFNYRQDKYRVEVFDENMVEF